MGLDGVELVLATEEAFDISITDAEASGIQTVGQLEALVLEKLKITGKNFSQSTPCLSAFAFNRLRTALIKHFGVSRNQVRLETRLEDLLPSKNRAQNWKLLTQSIGWSLPKLALPKWFVYLVVFLSCTWVAGLVAASAFNDIPGILMFIFGLTVALILAPVIRYISPLPNSFPTHMQDVRALIAGCLSEHFAQVKAQCDHVLQCNQSHHIDEVRQTVRKIVAEQLGVDLAEVVPTARFIEDLHMD